MMNQKMTKQKKKFKNKHIHMQLSTN